MNTIALYWEEKPTSLMNENKWIEISPNNNCRVCWRYLLRWKNASNHNYINNNARNFQCTKFPFIDSVLTDRRSLSDKRPKSASGKYFSCRFSFSAERNPNTKATEYVTFGFSFGFLPLLRTFEPHSLSAIRIFSCFSRHNSRKLRQTTCQVMAAVTAHVGIMTRSGGHLRYWALKRPLFLDFVRSRKSSIYFRTR